MAASSSSTLLAMGEEYVLPSSNSSKPLQYLLEVIGLDHCYCKPWSSQQRVPNPRPVKTLFSRDAEQEAESKSSSREKKDGDVLVDVDSVDEDDSSGPSAICVQYEVMKSKVAMGECEKYVSCATSRRTPDTWEELISRTGWTNQQNLLFDKILKIVSSYRLARLTYEGSNNEPVLRRIALDKATKRMRQILSRIQWDPRSTTWLHSSMVDGLSVPLLACYLDIIQTLRSKVPSLVDKMVAGTSSHRRVSPGTTDNLTSLLKRPWDAAIGLSPFQRQRKVSGPPLLLIVPSGPTTTSSATNSKRSRFWQHHLSNLGKVIPVTMHLSNSGRGVSIGQCLDHMIGAVQAKVLELKNHFPNRPVVLIGWSTGALVSFQVSLKEPVCAVVCLGFPILGVEGLRGDADDPFLESKTPTMFVFGSLSTCCSLPDIEEFRKKLLVDTSLLLIGGADDQLRLTSSKKKMEGVTQSMVDMRIMDEIGEFLSSAVSAMNNNMQHRTDYFDFDEIESRRKKPKTEKRKRSAGDGVSSGVGGQMVKKPKSKATKPATPRSQGNTSKKTKAVKTNTKRGALGKPVAMTSGPALVAGNPPVRPAGTFPISALRTTASTVPGGLIQGVNVPISRVSVHPLSGVTIPLSRVSVPVSAVNIPVSVSAVIKQGSLGGRSFVFTCPQAASDGVNGANAAPPPGGAVNSGASLSTPQLRLTMNSSSDVAAQNQPHYNVAPVTSCAQQPVAEDKSEVASSKSSTDGVPSSVTVGAASSVGLATTSTPSKASSASNSAAVTLTSSHLTTSDAASNVTSSSAMSSRVTSSSVASLRVTSSNVPSLNVTSSSVTSSSVSSSNMANKQVTSDSLIPAKRVVGSSSAATTTLASGQAQFIMRKGQLSAVSKPSAIRTSPASSVERSKEMTSGPSSRGDSATTTAGTGNPQQTSANTQDTSAEQSVSRSDRAATSQATSAGRTPSSPHTATRTIQVGVSDVKKPVVTKRTVTYSPSTSTKTINVVSRTGSPSVVAAMVSRTTIPGNSIQSSTAITGGYRSSLHLKNVQDLSKKSLTASSASTQRFSKQAMNPHTLDMQAKNLQRASAQLVSASLASARSMSTSNTGAQSSTGESGKNTQTISNRSSGRYHEDEKLVEKIRGIVKDVVNSTPRAGKPGAKQRIVVAATTTSDLAAGRKNRETGEKKAGEESAPK